ncbi:MAG: hypothetical protein MRZ79_03985 [Bacteroidia bacterium]|nr:hypothetical protein [Bacteroidia bacterium]
MKASRLFKVHFFLSLTLIIGMGLLESCRKYDDGPTFSLRSREERVANTWTANSLTRNTIDETNLYETYTMKFGREGKLEWTTKKFDGDQEVIFADWELFRVDEEIKITLTDPDPVSGERLSFSFEIRRLKETELWLHFIMFGDEWDVQLVE